MGAGWMKTTLLEVKAICAENRGRCQRIRDPDKTVETESKGPVFSGSWLF